MSGAGRGASDRLAARDARMVRVLVVTDTAARRAEVGRGLEADGDITVTGQARNALEAVAEVQRLQPDVVIIDLPAAVRLHAVEQIMGQAPIPILVMEREEASAASATDLIRAGALGAIAGPGRWTPAVEADVRRHVRLVRGVTVVRHPRGRNSTAAPVDRLPADAEGGPSGRLVAIAASTGGPAALATVLAGMTGVAAPVLVVQHIHVDFVDGLIEWMARVAPVPVQLATDGEVVKAGVVYVGPGNLHLKIGPGSRIVLDPDPPSRHRPSADQLFFSVARHLGPAAVGVVLTGMGEDGAAGLLAMRQRGGLTIAQDEGSSAVFGMPRAAHLSGAASMLLPLPEIAAAVVAATVGRRP